MNEFHVYLISDSTGDTVCSVAQAALAQFDNISPKKHVYSLIRTKGQMQKILDLLDKNPGFVMYTIVNEEIRTILKEHCKKLQIPCVAVIARVIAYLSAYLNMQANPLPGKQHEVNDDYFKRVEAINFALAHDDGQSTWDIDEADIVLVGVSRTSKSPTCIYLAYRGLRTANIPFVTTTPLPDILYKSSNPLIVGLTISAERLMQIRKSRLISIKETSETSYVDIDSIKDELIDARKIFTKNNWPVIDVTRKSVEETAATILQLYNQKKNII